ncbi:MAG: NYN domain-containing protein [Acidobacteria bacterium]|nr:NYN domain-containing protein [Acidobacteriota bacterium]
MDTIEQIAVFVDIENLIGFCDELNLPIELTDVIEKLKEEGRIVVRRSFGDIPHAIRGITKSHNSDYVGERAASSAEISVRRMLRDNLFLHEDIPYKNKYKNSADMRLAVEVLYTAFTLPNISKFAIVSGDSDYVPLFLKLKEQNKTVIGITGSNRGTAEMYRRACDSLFYFTDISQAAMAPLDDDGVSPKLGIEGAEPLRDTNEDHPTAEQQTLRDEYAGLLVRVIQSNNQSGKATPLQGQLQLQMRQLQADFNLERAGFASFVDLVAYADKENLVKVSGEGADVHLVLSNRSIADEQEQAISTAQYRMYLQEHLKCQLPTFEFRQQICEQAWNQIKFSDEDGGILLSDLSRDVADELASNKGINIPQASVFKYLYSLYLARCFSYEETDRQFNPKIVGFRAQKEEWDEHFVGLQLRSLARDAGFEMYPQKLSRLFYESDERSMHIKRLLDLLTIKYERA